MCLTPAGRTVAVGRAIAGQPVAPRPVEESPGSMETRWRLTAAGGDPRESATESKPPKRCAPAKACHARKGAHVAARMKGCGKSAPRRRRRRRQGKPHREQNRIGMAGREATRRQVGFQTSHPGWLLEGASNGHPRRMAVAGASSEAPRQNPAYRPAGVISRLSRCYFVDALTNSRADLPDSICPEKNREIAGRSARKVNCWGPLVGVISLR